MNWDKNSDQPFVEMDPKKKRKARLKQFDEMLKILGLALIFYPIGYLIALFKQNFFFRSSIIEIKNFFGVAVNLDKFPKESVELINELEIDTITIRVPLWEISKIDEYVTFAKSFQTQEILFILMQSREIVTDNKKLENAVRISFEKLSPISKKFQFGVAINRYKWGYFTTKEYLQNIAIVERVKKEFQDLELLGSSVIDFEYLLSIRTLFNFYKFKLKNISSLLYVDRRGAPENKQGGLNLLGKIEFLYFLNLISFKTEDKKIYITETNWPIKDSYPYTPTSNDECVTEEEQANYLVRYYLLALVTGKIKSVYWHQLLSPGFGLIDFREGLRKRDSFYALKFLNKSLKDTSFVNFEHNNNRYKVTFEKQEKTLEIFWGEGKSLKKENKYKYYKITGEEIKKDLIEVFQSPIYKIEV